MEFFGVETRTSLKLPLFADRIRAGFPSPAEDFVDRKLDLNMHLIRHPAATFFVKVQGDSMIDVGIGSGDILIVDKSLDPKNNDIVIACLNREFTVKVFMKDSRGIWLVPANRKYKPIRICNEDEFEIWGVVTNGIKAFC